MESVCNVKGSLQNSLRGHSPSDGRLCPFARRWKELGEELGEGRVDVFVAIPLGISRITNPRIGLVDFLMTTWICIILYEHIDDWQTH